MDDCSLCHAEVVAGDDRSIVSTTLHVDGQVNIEFDSACTACHGSGNPAPPRDLDAQTATTAPGVGAHQAHIEGSARARAVPCAECHLVPDDVLDPGHLDDARPAELVFSGAAVAFGASPAYAGGACSGTPCHGAAFPDGNDSGGSQTLPSWTLVDGSQITCGSCHGLPPPAPHPYYSSDCSACHENVADDDQSFVRPELHVDGVVTFRLP
jgi:predicted CxxxxCH...CXXCH cytochrome family protein